jgi:ADP-ribose pyrophosphatase
VHPERLAGSRRVYEGHVVNLRVDDVELPSGHRQVREIVEHRGAVAVVPLIEDDVFLVRQFRRAASRTLLEIPAGSMEAGEEPEACLQRELAEEIGMQAGQVTHMVSFYPSPGFLTEVVHVYIARNLSSYRLDAEEEDLEVVRLPLARARALVGQEIVDAKSIIGLLLASPAERAS